MSVEENKNQFGWLKGDLEFLELFTPDPLEWDPLTQARQLRRANDMFRTLKERRALGDTSSIAEIFGTIDGTPLTRKDSSQEVDPSDYISRTH